MALDNAQEEVVKKASYKLSSTTRIYKCSPFLQHAMESMPLYDKNDQPIKSFVVLADNEKSAEIKAKRYLRRRIDDLSSMLKGNGFDERAFLNISIVTLEIVY